MPLTLSLEQLAAYRAQTFRLNQPVGSREEAVEWVVERGFIYFWPITGVLCPSLWTAVAGERAVAEAHDDPGHVTWGWKDAMLGTRQWYYAKILRGKGTMISLDLVPYFYALSENFGEPESDYLEQYQQGTMTREAKTVYETLLQAGPMDTVRLRREAHLSSKGSQSAFDRALVSLQQDFKVLPVGIAEAGAWRYSHVYACVHQWYPGLPTLDHPITRATARQKLVATYLGSVGAASAGDVRQLFQWKPTEVDKTLQELVDAGILVPNVTINGNNHFALTSLLN
ncbi:MAG: hypothetical protein Fur0021_18880 [Candidatus Promineifilaceae bacterium]